MPCFRCSLTPTSPPLPTSLACSSVAPSSASRFQPCCCSLSAFTTLGTRSPITSTSGATPGKTPRIPPLPIPLLAIPLSRQCYRPARPALRFAPRLCWWQSLDLRFSSALSGLFVLLAALCVWGLCDTQNQPGVILTSALCLPDRFRTLILVRKGSGPGLPAPLVLGWMLTEGASRRVNYVPTMLDYIVPRYNIFVPAVFTAFPSRPDWPFPTDLHLLFNLRSVPLFPLLRVSPRSPLWQRSLPPCLYLSRRTPPTRLPASPCSPRSLPTRNARAATPQI